MQRIKKTVHLDSSVRGLECLRPHQLEIELLANEDIFHTETGGHQTLESIQCSVSPFCIQILNGRKDVGYGGIGHAV